jgi:Cu(I)/Ag(I) efflux system periplasmic protein CusF
MKLTFRNGLVSALLACGLAWGLAPALAQATAEPTQGEIRKVDKEAKKITIKHAEIKSLDMPPMTMVFQVKDASLLDNLKTGDKVQFRVVKEGSVYLITELLGQ